MAYSGRQFAKLAKTSRQRIAKALARGRLIAGEDGIDPGHPVNASYLLRHGVRYFGPSADIEATCRQVAARLALAGQRVDELRDNHHNHNRDEVISVTAALASAPQAVSVRVWEIT